MVEMTKQEEFLNLIEKIDGENPRNFLEMFMRRYGHKIVDYVYVTSCEHNHIEGTSHKEFFYEILDGSQLWVKDSTGKIVTISYNNYRKEVMDVWRERQKRRNS